MTDEEFIKEREKKGFDCEEKELSQEELDKCVKGKKQMDDK